MDWTTPMSAFHGEKKKCLFVVRFFWFVCWPIESLSCIPWRAKEGPSGPLSVPLPPLNMENWPLPPVQDTLSPPPPLTTLKGQEIAPQSLMYSDRFTCKQLTTCLSLPRTHSHPPILNTAYDHKGQKHDHCTFHVSVCERTILSYTVY